MEKVQTVVLHTSETEIVIRPKMRGESYPTHQAVRILLSEFDVDKSGTIHLVRKYRPLGMYLELLFEPEKNWRRCPNCKKKDWSAWMPVQMHYCDHWPDGSKQKYHSVQWYIICIHCGSIVDVEDYPPYPSAAYEYVYDPAEDVKMRWVGWRR